MVSPLPPDTPSDGGEGHWMIDAHDAHDKTHTRYTHGTTHTPEKMHIARVKAVTKRDD